TQIPRNRPNVRPPPALDLHPHHRPFIRHHLNPIHPHLPRLHLHRLPPAHPVPRPAPPNLQRATHPPPPLNFPAEPPQPPLHRRRRGNSRRLVQIQDPFDFRTRIHGIGKH